MKEENQTYASELRHDTSEVSKRLKVLESKIDGLVPHVLQLENGAIFIVGLIVLLQILDTLRISQPDAEINKIYWFVPYAALFLATRVIKVLNPYNRFLDIVDQGLSYAGPGALTGGSITGLLSGGLGAPAGAAIGGGAGFVIGIGVGLFKTRRKAQPPDTMTCPRCQSEIKETDKFCESCGLARPLSSVNCTNCDAVMSPQAKFCPKCGNAREGRTHHDTDS